MEVWQHGTIRGELSLNGYPPWPRRYEAISCERSSDVELSIRCGLGGRDITCDDRGVRFCGIGAAPALMLMLAYEIFCCCCGSLFESSRLDDLWLERSARLAFALVLVDGGCRNKSMWTPGLRAGCGSLFSSELFWLVGRPPVRLATFRLFVRFELDDDCWLDDDWLNTEMKRIVSSLKFHFNATE